MCWREWKLCAPSLVLACLQCSQDDGSLSLGWWSNWQSHRWLRLAETVGVHLVPPLLRWGHLEPGAHVQMALEYLWGWKLYSLPNNLCFCLVTLTVEKNVSDVDTEIPICAISSGPATCGGSWKNKTNPSVSPSAHLYVLTCMQIKSPADAHYSWFPMSASLK